MLESKLNLTMRRISISTNLLQVIGANEHTGEVKLIFVMLLVSKGKAQRNTNDLRTRGKQADQFAVRADDVSKATLNVS